MPGLKAVILVGGMGTRLRPLTDFCPKPMVPVLNRPFLEHTLAHLKEHGVTEIVLAMSYLPESIREYFGDGERLGMRLRYAIEKVPLGTAGAVKNAADYLDGPFIVLNGDNVFIEMDLDEAFAFHRGKRAKASIFLTRVENPAAFGVVETDVNQRVQRFIEKPPPGTTTSHWINAGGYILDPEVLEYIPAGQHYMFEKGLFPGLLNMGAPIYGYRYRGYWLDIGTLEQYLAFNTDILESRIRSPLLPDYRPGVVYRGPGVDVHPSAVVKGPVFIGGGGRIGRGTNITGPVSLGRDCILEEGVSLTNAVLWDSVRVGADARLEHCIVSNNSVIEDCREVRDGVVTPSQTVPLSRQ